MLPHDSPTVSGTAWAPNSVSARENCTRAALWASKDSPPTSTSFSAKDRPSPATAKAIAPSSIGRFSAKLRQLNRFCAISRVQRGFVAPASRRRFLALHRNSKPPAGRRRHQTRTPKQVDYPMIPFLGSIGSSQLQASVDLAPSHSKTRIAENPPQICAAIKGRTSAGRIPANVSLNERAIVTAGFANDVEAVNQ